MHSRISLKANPNEVFLTFIFSADPCVTFSFSSFRKSDFPGYFSLHVPHSSRLAPASINRRFLTTGGIIIIHGFRLRTPGNCSSI
jgi:hypothetical protein